MYSDNTEYSTFDINDEDALDENDIVDEDILESEQKDYMTDTDDSFQMYSSLTSEPIPYDDRELSWIKFNRRILDLALRKDIPLLERVKFLSITNSNLDEFFSIRVASRLFQTDVDAILDIDRPIVSKIIRECNSISSEIDDVYNDIITELNDNEIPVKTLYTDENEFTHDKIVKYSEIISNRL